MLELGVHGGLVAFDRNHQMGAAGGDLFGVGGLSVEGVGDEQQAGQAAEHGLDGVEQRCERGNFVRFRVDGDLGDDDAGAGVQRGQQMDLAAVAAAGSAKGLAVHGDHRPVPAWPGRDLPSASLKPAGQDGCQLTVVEAGQQSPHRRADGQPTVEAEPVPGLVVEVVEPVSDRGERRRPGQHGADRDGEQPGQGGNAPHAGRGDL